MAHPKNNEYVRKWRELNYRKHLKQSRQSQYRQYHFKRGAQELMRIDPTIFF
jgi:hypothetical protein